LVKKKGNKALNILIVGIGGFLGATLRYLIGLIPMNKTDGFPIKTLCINIVGSFLIGLIATYSAKHSECSESLQLFIKVGICGGFTTFSSFALETTNLIDNGNTLFAIMYTCLSVILGIAAVYAAGALVR